MPIPSRLAPLAQSVLAIGAFFVASAASAATITFFDGDFAGADWSATKIVDTTAGATASFVAVQGSTGGNPGAYRQVTHAFDAGNIYVGHLASGATYDPSASGAIVSLDYSYDLIHINPPAGQAVAYAIVIEQGGSWYSSTPFDAIFPETWTGFGAAALTAANFARRAGNGPSTPDFSDTGGVMSFGYLSANANTGGAPGLVRISGIDNWRVELTTVPLPAGAWLLATAFSAVLINVRRRSR